jgi:hypothetical protein
MRAITCLLLLSMLTACAHQAKKVDCDKHLTAINPPTPVVKPDTAPIPTPP